MKHLLAPVRISLYLVSLFFIFPSLVFAYAKPTVFFNPQSASIDPGQTIDTIVSFDTAGESSGGVGVIINYNPSIVEVVSITPSATFDDYPLTDYDNVAGVLKISGIVFNPKKNMTGSFPLASVTFKGKSGGTAKLEFDHTSGDTTDSNIAVNYGIGDVLADAIAGSITVSGPASANTTASTDTTNTTSTSKSSANQNTGILAQAKNFIASIFNRNSSSNVSELAMQAEPKESDAGISPDEIPTRTEVSDTTADVMEPDKVRSLLPAGTQTGDQPSLIFLAVVALTIVVGLGFIFSLKYKQTKKSKASKTAHSSQTPPVDTSQTPAAQPQSNQNQTAPQPPQNPPPPPTV